MKKTVNLLTLSVFIVTNIFTPLTNFIYAKETETLEEGGDLSVVRDMENIGNDNEVIPQTAPEESWETSKESVETPNPEDSQSEENITPDEQPSEETQGDEQVNKQEDNKEDNKEDNQSDESSVELADPRESHNSATTPIEAGKENNNTSATQSGTVEDDINDNYREIMWAFLTWQTDNRDLNIECNAWETYYQELWACATRDEDNIVYYWTGNDGKWFISIISGDTILTILDKNEWADIAWTGYTSYGNHYQWWNNHPFEMICRSNTSCSNPSSFESVSYSSSPAIYQNYQPWHRYDDSSFVQWSNDYWSDNRHYDILWWWNRDSTTNNRWWIHNGSTRKGPCPDGYHIPSAWEWDFLVQYFAEKTNQPLLVTTNWLHNTSSDVELASKFKNIFKIPAVGFRSHTSTNPTGQWQWASYRTSSPISPDKAFYFSISEQGIIYGGRDTVRADSVAIRCFKDSQKAPETLTLTFDENGWDLLWATNWTLNQIVASWDLAQEPIAPTKNGETFGGWYDNPEFNGSHFNFTTPITEDITLYAKWAQCAAWKTYYPEIWACATKSADNIVYYRIDENNNNVISIKDPNGNTVLTMLDKNEWATIAWNNGDSLTQANMWSHFQRWNNYGFSQTPEPTKSQDRAEYKNYRPGHSYNNSTFIWWSSNPDYRQNDIHYNNLWWWGNDKWVTTSIDTFRWGIKNWKTRQWPCNTGYHVPSMWEWNAAITYRWNTKNPDSTQKSTTNFCYIWNSDSAEQPDIFASDFKLPKAGYRDYYSSSYGSIWYNGYYLSSSPRPSDYSNSTNQAYRIWFTSDNVSTDDLTNRSRASGFSVRCFKDSPEAPETRTVTFQSNGGNLLWATNWNLIQLVEDGKKAQQPIDPTISETGKTFTYWENVTNNSEFNLSNTNITGDITLKAIYDCDTQHGYHKENDACVADIYTITFKDGNTVLSLQPTSGTYGTHITLPTAPAKNGYEFKWWYKESTFNNLWNQSTDIVTNNTTIYAKYDPIYVVTFDSDWWSSIAPYSVEPWSKLLYIWSKTKYSHTQNVDDTWRKTDNYNNNWSNSNIRGTDRTYASSQAHVLTFPGATKLIVNLYYNGESINYDWVSVWKWNYPSYTADNRTSVGYVTTSDGAPDNNNKFGGSWSNTYTVNGNTLTNMWHSTLNIPGDSVTFSFKSDTSYYGQWYGYYAVIQPILKIPATQPTKDWWVFDGWYKPNGEKWNYDQDTVTQDITLKAHWREPRAVLSPWQSFNVTLKSLVNSSIQSYSTIDSTIKNFVRSKTNWWSNKKLISDPDLSEIDIWAWYDNTNNTVYYYADTDKIYLNSDSSYMFYNMQGLTWLDLSNFDTSNVTNMKFMFEGCSNLNSLTLDNWNLSNMTESNMQGMFSSVTWLKKLSLKNWKTPTSFTSVIWNRYTWLTAELDWIDVSDWDLSQTTNLNGLFWDNKTHEIRWLDTWDTSNIQNISNMFGWCPNLTSLNLDNWNLSKLNITSSNSSAIWGMYSGTPNLKTLSMKNWVLPVSAYQLAWGWSNSLSAELDWIDVSWWDLSKTTDLNGLFWGNKTNKIIWMDTWDTSNVQNMNNMFNWCSNLTELNLSNFDTSNVTNMSVMFNGCSNLKSLNLDNWDLSKLSNPDSYSSMFGWASSLEKVSMKRWEIPTTFTHAIWCRTSSLCSTTLQELDVTDWDLSKTTSIQWVFGDSKTKQIIWLDTWNTSNIQNMNNMFYWCKNLTWLNLSGWNTSNVEDMSAMFYWNSSLTELNLSGWNTSKVQNMSAMFYWDNKLKTLDVSHFNTSNVTNMANMFEGCSKLKTLDVSHFNTSKVSDMSSMFRNCTSLTGLNLDNFNTSAATNMQSMFGGCNKLTKLDLSNFNTSQVSNMSYMFQNCSSLKDLNVSTFNTSNVTDVSWMFKNCSSLTGLDLSNLNTSQVSNMNSMFQNCASLKELNISSWDTNNVTNMASMFDWDSKLTTVYASNKFVTNRASNSTMFQDTYEIRWWKGTKYNISELGTKYARIDEKWLPWYFTDILDVEYPITYDTNWWIITWEKVTYTAKESFDLVVPTKQGYNFIWWAWSNGNDPKIQVTIQTWTTWDLYFIANWVINNYKIIFDTNWWNDIPFIEREYNSSLADISLPSPTKDGYIFQWWNRALPATMPGEDITLVAQWKSESKESSSSWWGWWGRGNSSAIDIAKESIDNNTDTHNAAEWKDEKDEKEGKDIVEEKGTSVNWNTTENNMEAELSHETLESTYSPEFIEAYNFAKTNWITTQTNIQKAKIDSPLTRIAMAKMLSYYAINVLWQDPDMTQTIKFEDVSDKRDAEYDNGVTLAYQLGIMWINMKNNKFRPDDEVTRAEFVTALSRMIYGMKDGTWKMKYYEPHMTRMYNEWIISNTNPKMKEKRWYVMIMLMRTVK